MIADKHKGHDIVFDTDSEEWKCGSLALADKSLAKIKRAIDRASKERRRVNVQCLFLSERWNQTGLFVYSIKTATIVLLREGDRKADVRIQGEKGSDQVEIRELFTLSQRPLLEAYIAKKTLIAKIEDEAKELEETFERMSAEAVREAVARAADEAA